MNNHARLIILILRIGASAVMVMVVWLLFRVMLVLPWQLDWMIAMAATAAFAYRFEDRV